MQSLKIQLSDDATEFSVFGGQLDVLVRAGARAPVPVCAAERQRLLCQSEPLVHGEHGAWLRRNGLYAAQVWTWRKARHARRQRGRGAGLHAAMRLRRNDTWLAQAVCPEATARLVRLARQHAVIAEAALA